MRNIFWVIMIITCITACSKKVPLNKKQFTSLLIDMHMVDGTLSVWKDEQGDERKKYMYYNDLFEKYGITKAEFDSCIHYYSAQSALFAKMYDVVIDSLNRRLTNKLRIYKQLTVNDSINLLPGYKMWVFDTLDCDSIRLQEEYIGLLCAGNWIKKVALKDTVVLDERNPYLEIELNNIVPGKYRFSTDVKFDHKNLRQRNRIVSYFVSEQNDTLKVPDISVALDSFERNQSWTYFVPDSSYNRLVIRILDDVRLKKEEQPWTGKIWNTGIFKLYVSPKEEERNLEYYRLKK